MKTQFRIFLVCFLMATPSAFGATLVQLRARIDTWLSNRWDNAVAKQETFNTNNGHYFQGLITHVTIPVQTTALDADTLGDNLLVHPTDQSQNWVNIFPTFQTDLFPAALVFDIYNGPQGKGWVATLYVRHDGTLYSRTKQVGPETFRDQAWHVVVPGP